MRKVELIELCGQAIEAEETRLGYIDAFLKKLPLDNEMNKAVALELVTVTAGIEDSIEKLTKKREELTLK